MRYLKKKGRVMTARVLLLAIGALLVVALSQWAVRSLVVILLT
jgi:hypothetical protein